MSEDATSRTGSAPQGPSSARPETGGPAPRRKRRRWPRRLAAIVILLAVLVFVLPYLASTGTGTRWLVGLANRWIPGEMAVQKLSLRWLGSCMVGKASLRDLEGREVISVDQVVYGSGLWRAIVSWAKLGNVEIDGPRVSLYSDKDGRISLIDALVAPDTAPREKADSALPPLTGRITLRDGSVQMVRADGRRLDVSQINASCTLSTLDNIDGTLSMQMPANGDVSGEFKVKNLAPRGRSQPFDAAGTLRLSTPKGLSVAELIAFALDGVQGAGRATVALDGAFENGTVRLELKTGVTGLQARHGEGGRIEPIDGQVVTAIQATRESLTGKTTLETQAGAGQFDLVYPLTGQPSDLSAGQLLSAILAGNTGALPKLTLDGRCHLDLARLAKSVPALLAIRPGVEVASGTLDIEKLAVRGAAQPSLSGSVVLKNLVARGDGKTIQWEPASLGVEALVEQGRGLKVQRGEFKSGFGQITATGTASELHADLQADLANLHRQLNQVIELGGMEMAGKLSGVVDLKRAGENRINTASTLRTEGLRYAAGQRRLELGKVLVTATGYIEMAASSVKEMVTEAKAEVDGKIVATANSKSSMASKTYQAELNVSQADLAYVGGLLQGLGVLDGKSSYAGNAVLQATARRISAGAPVLSDGSLVLRQASISGRPVSKEDVTVRWSEVSAADDGALKAKSVQLVSSIAHLTASAVDCRFGKPVNASGKLQGDADLAALLDVTSRISGQEKPPAIAGKLTLSADCSSASGAARLQSNWTIDDLAVGSGEQVFRDKQLRLTLDSAIQQAQDTLDISRLALESRLLTLKLAGTVSELSGARRLALKGDYSGSWEAITTLLHELAPATRETVAIKGATASSFEVSGSAYQPRIRPVFEEVSTELGITWDSAAVYGMNLGKAVFKPALRQGRLTLPLAGIPASGGGQVRLGGVVDFHPEDPTLLIRDRTVLMENIPVTPQLGRQLLSRINPLFGFMSRAEGMASLFVEGIELPLSDAITRRGAGRGRLDLRDLKVQPSGFMSEIISLGGIGGGGGRGGTGSAGGARTAGAAGARSGAEIQGLYTVQVEGVDFALKDGRIAYQNLALIFVDNFDLRFRGSVGFDDTLDLIMSVPVRPAVLERFGVRGPLNEYARLLADARVDIPMVGTRSQPKLDLAKVDMKPLVQRAMRDAVSGQATDLLKGLGGVGQPASPAGGKTPAPGTAKPPADSPAKGALDLLNRTLQEATSKPSTGRRGR